MSQRNQLNLDRIVASQPELGPSIPDGGYSWVILLASLFLQIFIPSILSSYGIFMLFARIEVSALNDDPKLWDTILYPTAVVYMAFLTLADPWSRTIVATSTWPRLVTTTGVFLTCAGILIQWVAVKEMSGVGLFMLSGALSGFGSSLALTQSEVLITQYFRLKLLLANNILICGYALGFIIMPMALGLMLRSRGIMHSLLIYQGVILMGCIIISVFKKPVYLKAERRRYEALQNLSEDDEMIFAKDLGNQHINPFASSENSASSSNSSQTVSPKNRLKDAFTNNEQSPTGAASRSDNDPLPIFLEEDVVNTNTNTYSFDMSANSIEEDVSEITHSPPERITASNFRQEISFLWKMSFYKSLFFLVTVKYSTMIFWTLFPTYLYVEMDNVHLQQTTFLVGSMGLGSLFIGLFISIFPVLGKNKHIVTSAFSLISSVGYFILSDAGAEGWLLFGALLITSSITALHVLNPTMIKYILRDDNQKAHTLLHTLTGILILLFLIKDIHYRNCFRIMSFLQLLSGSVFLYNFVYSYFKKICSRN